jgi:hypothetical protein
MATTIKVPKLRGARGMRAPQLKFPKPPRQQTEKGAPSERVELGTWDVGEGPWFVQGKKASKPEYRVARVLNRLGWEFNFQEAHFGGRRIAGGQILDYVLSSTSYPIVIDVRSVWHMGAAAEANDARKMIQIRASNPMARIVIVYEEQTENEELLYSFLLQELGAKGR